MTRRRIAGKLDNPALAALAGHVTDDEYIRRAQANRPDDAGLHDEVMRMFHSGLTAADISQALRLPLDQVQTWLARGTA